MVTTFFTLIALLKRDIFVYTKRLPFYLTNYLVLYPLNFIFTFGYLAPKTLMQTPEGAHMLMITLLAGNVLLTMLNLISNLTTPMLYDFVHTRYIEYELRHIRSSLLLLKNVAFNSIFAFLLLSPFFFLCKLLLQDAFYVPHISWPLVLLMTFLGSLCLTTYTLFAICFMRGPEQLKNFWVRCNIPMFVLGGFWAPWFIMYQASPTLGTLVLANPFIYITEGLRTALTGSDAFMQPATCIIAMLSFSMLFFMGAWYYFNKRMDPVG